MRTLLVSRLLLATVAFGLLVPLGGCSAIGGGGLSAPTKLGGEWETLAAWAAADNKPAATTNAKAMRADLDVDQAALSADFGGASALVERYVTSGLALQSNLRAVRAQAPTYFVHFSQTDKDYLQVGLAPKEVQNFGPVSCLVEHIVTPVGDSTETEHNTITECMRTSTNLTVWFGPYSAVPKSVVAVVNSAWQSLGGGSSTAKWPLSAGSDKPLSLPLSIGGLDAIDNTPGSPARLAEAVKERANDEKALRAIYGGAAAVAQQYATQDEGSYLDAYAVRTSIPTPYIRFENAKRLGELAPLQESLVSAGVTCEVLNQYVSPSGSKAELNPQVLWCVKSSAGLTVWVDHVYGDPTVVAPNKVIDITNELWTELSKG